MRFNFYLYQSLPFVVFVVPGDLLNLLGLHGFFLWRCASGGQTVFWKADFSWVVPWLGSIEPLLPPSVEGYTQWFLGWVGLGLLTRVQWGIWDWKTVHLG